MEQQQKQQHAHGNGFVLGVIVGVIIALLFSTKRGREILREVSEKGIEKLSDLEKLTKEYQGKDFLEDEELEEEEDYVKPTPAPKPTPAQPKVVEAPKAAPVKEAKAEMKEEPAEGESPSANLASSGARDARPKSVVKPAPQPEVEHEVIEPVEEKKTEKTITGRRWFRGLRKRG